MKLCSLGDGSIFLSASALPKSHTKQHASVSLPPAGHSPFRPRSFQQLAALRMVSTAAQAWANE